MRWLAGVLNIGGNRRYPRPCVRLTLFAGLSRLAVCAAIQRHRGTGWNDAPCTAAPPPAICIVPPR